MEMEEFILAFILLQEYADLNFILLKNQGVRLDLTKMSLTDYTKVLEANDPQVFFPSLTNRLHKCRSYNLVHT